ncbi:hypothetical protein AT000_00580 [Salmonella enterica]|uniref:Uncharacterized protein n=9 Tax=Salmonella enterica TaxID=28901 RepID=A0A5Y0MT77_SALET|nr:MULTISPECIES: hypothetical protein [Salmonella]EAA5552932.1 hypothetical protein [Salmonella enterica subsp. enterica serovar Cotham]EAB5797136.1 hypothetical protein [Salmonella enterica subsp. enterica serovar Butantan]EAB7443297.1 hypothetical protein [Salmonella enterica subsp. enterica serovar Anatum]EAU5127466.1 hypothetical protein [Salmonella enterica subsp. enterica serovar Infantis]EBC9965199.1 hypothetical protein [Salmonella enterica subsp. enterica serovar Kentucky]EBH9925208.
MSDSKEFRDFWAEVSKVAAKYKASADGKQGELFARELYSDYLNVQPKNKKAWLDEMIKFSFVSMKDSPKWVGEYDWPYFNGRPMVFLEQFKIPLSAQHIDFPRTDTHYIFASKKDLGDGFSCIYKIIIQKDNGNLIHSNGDGYIEF